MDWPEVVASAREISWIAYIGTADGQGRPHVAVVSPGFTDGTVWFATRRGSKKIRNIGENPRVAFHWPVLGAGPGELALWGEATIRDSDDDRHRLWTSANLVYDPAMFFESPDNPDFVFVEVAARRAVLTGPDFAKRVWRSA